LKALLNAFTLIREVCMFERIAIAFLMLVMVISAQTTINLKGVVKDRVYESPIKDAIVRFQGKSVADTTDSMGRFSLSFASPVLTNKLHPDIPSSPRFIPNKGIIFSIKQAVDVRLEIINLAGKCVKAFTKSSLESGVWAFSPVSLSSGTYLCRIRLGSAQTIVRFISSGQNFRGRGISRIANDGLQELALAKTARTQSDVDTIQVAKVGFYTTNFTWVEKAGDSMVIFLQDTTARDGVKPGIWKGTTKEGKRFSLTIDSTGKEITSAIFDSLPLLGNNFQSIGHLAISDSGIARIGDTLSFYFSDTAVAGCCIVRRTETQYLKVPICQGNCGSFNPTTGMQTCYGNCTYEWTSTSTKTYATTFSGQWVIMVTFNCQGGSSVEAQSFNFGGIITEPVAPTRTGYTFGGWYKEAACTNTWNFATETVTASVILYAKWTINQYTVTFNSLSGSAVAEQTIGYGGLITEPTAPTRTGYTFGGWYKEAAGTNAWVFVSQTVTADVTLFARWSTISCTVTFNTQGGSAITAQTISYGGLISQPTAPMRTGYTFGGWYKESECGNAWNFATQTVTATVTLYAKWTINQYTVTFNSQGGSEVSAQTVNYGSLVNEPTSPTRTGYVSGGWYKEAACTNAWNFVTETVSGNVTLYAKWKSSDADLSELSLSEGSLSPAFSTTTNTYSVSVPNATTSITVTPTAAEPGALITVNGTAVVSGSTSSAISLNVGSNTVAVVVTAQDGVATKTFAVTVTRAPSNNADLSGLVLSAVTLTPAFASGTTTYSASLSYGTASITVTPKASGPGATIKVNGITVVSGSASDAISLNVGSNTVTVVVTAQDGITLKTYGIIVDKVGIVGQFSTPGSSPTGLAWDGNNLWVIDKIKKMFKLDTLGNILYRDSVPFYSEGMAWDGTGFWVSDGSRQVKLDTNGNPIDTLNVYYWARSGITWDGSNFWISDYNFNVIHKHDPSGSELLHWNVPSGSGIEHATGIAYNGTTLLIGDPNEGFENNVCLINTVGQLIKSFDTMNDWGIAAGGHEYKTLAWDGKYLWYSSDGLLTIYKIYIGSN
jgi:uncharacterized repeat protein (TIGR02543 family)